MQVGAGGATKVMAVQGGCGRRVTAQVRHRTFDVLLACRLVPDNLAGVHEVIRVDGVFYDFHVLAMYRITVFF